MKGNYGPHGLILGGAAGLAGLLPFQIALGAPGWLAYPVVWGCGLIGAVIGVRLARQ